MAKKSDYSLFIIFFFNSLKNRIIHYFFRISLFTIHYFFRISLFTIHYFLAHYSLFIIKKGHYSLIIMPHPDPHVLVTQKNRLNETVHLSTQNICLNWWVRKYLHFYAEEFCLSKPVISRQKTSYKEFNVSESGALAVTGVWYIFFLQQLISDFFLPLNRTGITKFCPLLELRTGLLCTIAAGLLHWSICQKLDTSIDFFKCHGMLISIIMKSSDPF